MTESQPMAPADRSQDGLKEGQGPVRRELQPRQGCLCRSVELIPPKARNILLQSLHTSTHVMTSSDSRFGFVAFAETWNGRMAMLGFVIGLATELLTGQGILSQIGLG